MTSQVEVPPLTGLIHFISGKRRVNAHVYCTPLYNTIAEIQTKTALAKQMCCIQTKMYRLEWSFFCIFYFILVWLQHFYGSPLTLSCQSQQLLSALSSACDFKSHFCKQCGPRSDCSSRSSLIRVHTVCLYAKIGLKSLQEYSADDINRRHFHMTVFLVF